MQQNVRIGHPESRTRPTRRGISLDNDQTLAILFVLPATILILAIIVWPLLRGVYLGFTDANGLTLEENFIGLGNFVRIAKDRVFWISLSNSIVWTVGTVGIGVPIAFAGALLLNERIRGRGVFRGLILVPWVTPMVVAAVVWQWIYSFEYGVMNYVLWQLGIIGQYISVFADSQLAMPAALAASIWKGVPFKLIVLLAGLQGIPEELYEVAKVDGANAFQRFRHITLPQMRSILTIVIILQTVWAFNGFDLLYVLTRGGPGWATHVLSIYVYLSSFQYWELGYGAAMAVVMLAIMLVFAVLFIRQVLESF